MKYKVLIVDDEKDIVNLLKDFFEIQGYEVYTAYSGEEAIEKVEKNPHIILLDVNMPNMDGIEVCRRIRDFVDCPIVFLTAKVQEQDRINGLMSGGDDYILKPFSIEELSVRVLAHLRREQRKVRRDMVKFSEELTISYSQRKLFYGKNEINLTKTEFDILELISSNAGQVFTKERIYEGLWGFDKDGDSNIITEHIRRIRTKLLHYSNKKYIETVWGVGYRWIG